MSVLPKGRMSKAASLIPLALLSAAWTASLAGVEPAASATQGTSTPLPDGSGVPSKAIQAPANVPIPGSIAPAVPDGSADSVVAGASTSGIPSAALAAYQRGAQIIDAADTTCNIPWELLAAIGRVESDHGQYGGNTLGSDGVSRPGVYGPQLNGKNGTQVIMDTDGGQLDHDPVYDRAVGPMQFLPSTWSSVRVDANGDGQRNPQDINDASLAAAVYLCSGKEDLGARSGQEAAIYRYNHSQQYVDLVLRIMEAYSQGQYTAIPSGTYGGTVFTPSYSSAIKARQQQAHTVKGKHGGTTAGSSGGSTGGSGTTGGGTGTTPTPPGTPAIPNPLGAVTGTLTKTVTQVTSGITQPIVATLATLAQATSFCSSQLGALADPLNLLGGVATNICAHRVQGMTESDASALIPNTLATVLKWLGLGG